MKLLLALMSLAAASATMPIFGDNKRTSKKIDFGHGIKADSPLGNKIMENARRVEENDEIDYTWVAGYSIKFQGCHHISQWNEEADGEEDVRVQTKRLARFRLCPSDECSSTNAGGCNSGYGDYIIDLNVFLDVFFEARASYWEYRCQYMQEMGCNCNQNNGGRRLDQDYCIYNCLVDEGIADECDVENPNGNNQQQEEDFNLEDYMECGQYDFNNGRRKLEQEEVQYFLGPYCASQGGQVFLGMFTDDQCTTFADEYGGKQMFENLSYGKELPYSDTSLIDLDCISCKEPEEWNNNGNDANDADEVVETCEQIYSQAGKCESAGLSGVAQYPNDNACTYMEGIKIVRKNGTIIQGSSTANKTASIFIGIFVVAFVLLAAYVYYLKTKLDRASINLSE